MAFLCDGDDPVNVAGNVNVPVLLDGGAGNDRLNTGGYRALLIGGTGQDRLVGGNRGDVLIGGSTNIDGDQAALLLALEAWDNSDLYEDRVAAISGLLTAVDHREIDTLTGAAGRDLFFDGFDGFGDDLTNSVFAEQVI